MNQKMNPGKKKSILLAAEKLFNRFGLKKTGMEEIAGAARVAKGTLYNYFGSKEGVFRELIREQMSLFEDMMQKSMAGLTDPIEKIKTALKARLRFLHHSSCITELLDEGRMATGPDDLLEEFNHRGKKIIQRLLEEAMEQGSIGEIDKTRVTDLLLKALKGFEVTLKDRPGDSEYGAIESEMDYLLTIIIQGIAANRGK